MSSRDEDQGEGRPLPDDSIALDLLMAAARFSRIAGRVPGVQYSTVAWRVLARLESGPARVSALAQLQRVAQPTMTALIHRLESEAWVTRSPDPEDGRAALVSITSTGAAALADYRRTAAAAVAPHLAELAPADLVALQRASELMRQLSEVIGDPSG